MQGIFLFLKCGNILVQANPSFPQKFRVLGPYPCLNDPVLIPR